MFGHGNALLPHEQSKLLSLFLIDGVGIFFVLSGFLIGGILIRDFSPTSKSHEPARLLLRFWERRWYRTLPAYILILSTIAVLHTASGKFPGGMTLLSHYTFTQNLIAPPPYWLFPESWSLSIEEWFYLTLPPTILFSAVFLRISIKKTVLTAAILTAALCPSLRAWAHFSTTFPDGNTAYEFFTKSVVFRIDSIAHGVIGAYAAHYHPTFWNRARVSALTAGIFIILIDRHFLALFDHSYLYAHTASYTVGAIGTLLTLPYLSTLNAPSEIVGKTVTHIALISYSMYLVNYSLILHVIIPTFFPTSHPYIQYTAFWLLTLGSSTLLYFYFEKPMLALRNWPKLSLSNLLTRKSG